MSKPKYLLVYRHGAGAPFMEWRNHSIMAMIHSINNFAASTTWTLYRLKGKQHYELDSSTGRCHPYYPESNSE